MPDAPELSDYGGLLLATRLRRLSDLLFAGVDRVYDARGFGVSARCVPILLLLRDNGPTSITDVARHLGQTHPAVSQMSRTLASSSTGPTRATTAGAYWRCLRGPRHS